MLLPWLTYFVGMVSFRVMEKKDSRHSSLSAVIDRYLERSDLSHGTVANYRSCFMRFLEFVGNKDVHNVTEADLLSYVEDRRGQGRLASTIHADVRRIRSLLRWGGVHSAPAPKRLGLKAPQGRTEFLSLEEVGGVLRWADSQVIGTKALIYLYLFTGGRANEVLSLERADFDLTAGWINFRLGTKNGTQRRVPICGQLAVVLNEWLGSIQAKKVFAGLRYDQALRIWKSACRAAGTREFTLHHARHTAASLWVMSGVDLVTVQNWLGHSSIQQTLVYAKVSPRHGHESMGRFEGWIADRL